MAETKKRKYTIVGFFYLLGLICAYFMGKQLSAAAFIILGIIFFVIRIVKGREYFEIMAVAAAFLVSVCYETAFVDKVLELDGKSAYVTGRITERRSPDNDTVLLSVDGEADGIPVKFTLFASDTGIEVGDKVKFTAIFSRYINKEYFAEETYYRSKGIFLKAYADSEISVENGTADPLILMNRLSGYFMNRLDGFFSDDAGAIIKAMLFGNKSELSPRLSSNINRSGISHLTAVSGMHLSMMAHIAAAAVKVVFGRKRRVAAFVASFYVILLSLFFGMTISVIRSGIMLLFYYGGEIIGRKTRTIVSIDRALLLIIGVNPCACLDVGLWLSVLGTFGVGVVSPLMHKKLRVRRRNHIKSLLVTSLSATLCTAPVGMFCFGGISLAAVITNLLVDPLFMLIMTFTPLGLILPELLSPLIYTAGAAAYIMSYIINSIGETEISYIETDNKTMACFTAVFTVSAVISLLLFGKETAIYTAVSVFCAFIAALSAAEIAEYDNIKLSVHSDGTAAVLTVSDKSGVSVYAVSDCEKTGNMIYEYAVGRRTRFVCVAADTDNNNEISQADYSCELHLPENGDMTYNLGEYSVTVKGGEIFLNIRGVSVSMTDIKSENKSDIAIRLGYGKEIESYGNSATVLCHKRFYNCNGAVNACYTPVEFVINPDGSVI